MEKIPEGLGLRRVGYEEFRKKLLEFYMLPFGIRKYIEDTIDREPYAYDYWISDEGYFLLQRRDDG
ncbi:MAG TPA: hypothetical protein ENG00_00575 [Candidatus Aenigmarchaeota archaeon]|nr:hypothetical protein [Candidatus Aenigmarchaeota archaeon]